MVYTRKKVETTIKGETQDWRIKDQQKIKREGIRKTKKETNKKMTKFEK